MRIPVPALLLILLASRSARSSECWKYLVSARGEVLRGADYLPYFPSGTHLLFWYPPERENRGAKIAPVFRRGRRRHDQIQILPDGGRDWLTFDLADGKIERVSIDHVPGFAEMEPLALNDLGDVLPFLPAGSRVVVRFFDHDASEVTLLARTAEAPGDPLGVTLSWGPLTEISLRRGQFRALGITYVP